MSVELEASAVLTPVLFESEAGFVLFPGGRLCYLSTLIITHFCFSLQYHGILSPQTEDSLAQRLATLQYCVHFKIEQMNLK
jgi:hypothetical protein